MKVLIFTRYDCSQAATRVRALQYLPFLNEAGIQNEIFPILASKGISGKSSNLTFLRERIKSYFRVAKRLFKERNKDSLVHFHIELFPYIPFIIEYGYLSLVGKKKYVIELDDAWFHRYDTNRSFLVKIALGQKIGKLMKASSLVIAGNQYIADYAKKSGAKSIEIIPTVVDVDKYQNHIKKIKPALEKDKQIKTIYNKEAVNVKPIIGWIGSPSTTKYLLTLINVIKHIDDNGIACFCAIGADSNQLKGLPIEIIPWSKQLELETLYKFDIGIMPLVDSLFEQGKCGFKLIQYMACGLPVVASPIGVNTTIVTHAETGFLAKTEDEWIHYLTLLCQKDQLREQMGRKGLKNAKDSYSLNAYSGKYVSLLKRTFNHF